MVEFTQGQIIRLKCENVLTYHEMEIFPCKQLNLIVGANGTGKSTIISAIILGLGGTATLVGRSKDLKEYIKLGASKAKIEIELSYKGSSVIIERSFDKKGSSKFFINGRPSSLEKVTSLTKNCSIQIDNLCQILPQEKLEEFARMNDHDRLVETLKTAGDAKLSTWLEDLKSGKDIEARMHREITELQRELADKINFRDSKAPLVKAVEEKIFLIDCLRLIKQRWAWHNYFHVKQTLYIVKKKMQSQQVMSRNVIDLLKTVMSEMEASYSMVANAKKTAEQLGTEVSKMTQTVKKKQNEISTKSDQLNDIRAEFKQKVARFKVQDEEVRILQEKIHAMKAKMGEVKDVDQELHQANEKRMKIIGVQKKVYTNQEKIKDNLRLVNHELNSTRCQLTRLNDAQESKRKMLRIQMQDAYKGLLWVEENQQRFKGEVYGPTFLYLSVDCEENAKYVETCIPTRDLLAFFCQNRDDTELLLKELKERQGLRISVVSALLNVNSEQLKPRYSINSLSHLMFRGFVSEFLRGPELIIQFMIGSHKLNNIPVLDADRKKVDQVPREISLFILGSLKTRRKYAEITGNKIQSSSAVPEARYLKVSANTAEIEKLQQDCIKFEKQMLALQDQDALLKKQYDEMKDKLNLVIAEIKQLNVVKSNEERNKRTLQEREADLRNLKNNVIDLEQERSTCHMHVKLTSAQICNLFVELCELLKKLSEAFIEYQKCKIDVEQAENMHQQNLNLSQKTAGMLKEESSFLQKLDSNKRKLKDLSDVLHAYSMSATKNVDPRQPNFPRRKIFFKLPQNLFVLDRLRAQFEAKVSCLMGEKDALAVFQEHKQTCAYIKHLEEKIEKRSRRLQNHYDELDQKKEMWRSGVKELIASIDRNFRRYFEIMHCSGAICLYEGDGSEDNFKKYGIHIKVKFREAGELQILNAQVQSGGERAVSVAIYLLSLQELTAVPFRCIDEINQGMDADNERRIFNLISKATEEPANTQYFLLTPKLLPNLKFPQVCKVFNPFNGLFALPHTELAKYNKLREERRSSNC